MHTHSDQSSAYVENEVIFLLFKMEMAIYHYPVYLKNSTSS